MFRKSTKPLGKIDSILVFGVRAGPIFGNLSILVGVWLTILFGRFGFDLAIGNIVLVRNPLFGIFIRCLEFLLVVRVCRFVNRKGSNPL